jgi:peroxiredoxin Q/BCP
MPSVQVGETFPDFTLPNQDGALISKGDLAGERAVIYFYPKDDTSGCTAQACGFQEKLPEIHGVRLVGVSPDSVKSHRKFADKYGLTFTLLADTQQQLSQAVGVWVEKSMYGKKYMGIERTTFVLDENGVITHVFEKVKPQGHADEIQSVLGK